MPQHTKKKPPSFPALAAEEWDFRNLPDDTDLQTLIEYEYLRSSPLREAIVKWHEEVLFPQKPTSAVTVAKSGEHQPSPTSLILRVV